jgi:LacI family transcriptional regulator
MAWLSGLEKPVGVFCFHDGLVRPLLDVCQQADLRVPEQIAVLGADNGQLECLTCLPPLSSVDLAAERIGYQAATLIDSMLKGETPEETVHRVPPVGVVTRRSSDMLAIDDDVVAQAVRYLRKHFSSPITIGNVVKHIPVSRRVFEIRFRNALARTPAAELRRLRIEHASRLLAETDLRVSAIARMCGFKSVDRLGGVFKRVVGTVPTDDRKQFKNSGS